MGKRIMIIAGEASGDMHGANLVKAIQGKEPAIAFFGVGGTALKETGVTIRVKSEELSVVGLSEVFSKIGKILKALSLLKKDLKTLRPDLLILIDFPDFNLRLAAAAKKLNIPVMYYISPQVWAWRTGRVKKIRRLVNEMVVILPFEVDFYKEHDIPVTFVGHPLLDNISPDDFNNTLNKEGLPIIGLLPGSRSEEVARLLPVMIEAAEIISEEVRGIKFIIPVAPSLDKDKVEAMVAGCKAGISIVQGNAYEVLKSAALVISASGTATLEATIFGTPMIIVYKVSPFSYWLGTKLIQVKYAGLANLIAGKEVVPELIQDKASPENIADHALRLLRNKKARAAMQQQLNAIRKELGSPGASDMAAKVALRML
ncbi:MAG: lipid-A-disaccharide synthase [Deltaproteobacteria bacterium]|nr:lipid-A-disaccharide synthase [Deltaproteobacteria bacterium]